MTAAGFEFPDELLYHVEHQVWARWQAPGRAVVGITALGVHLAGGEIYMCRPKTVGVQLLQGQGVAVVELAKSIVSVKSPVSGRVVAVNERLASQPSLVHSDPFGAGWIACLALTHEAQDRLNLLSGQAVVPAMTEHARLFRLPD